MPKIYEIRDPIHGFVELNEWERDIVNHWVFQRLRRIRQLGLTDMVYPGAMHTRFEHSLGVMHVATRMFDEVVKRRLDFLKAELSFTDGGLERDRVLVRLAALLHDVGHAPFSHVTEELMIRDECGIMYKHENYSAAAVKFFMKDVIENHPMNQNYHIKAREIADFLEGKSIIGRSLLWRSLVSGQLDADRADYLLRDSHHVGVAYGKYDLPRLLVTMTVAIDQETNSPVLAVEEGGIHAAEGLIVARYMMFTQVYFQHTRRAYDYHLGEAVKSLLARAQKDTNLEKKEAFPPPTTRENVKAYLEWNDWRVLGLINNGEGEEHGELLRERRHYRRVYETPEVPSKDDLEFFEHVSNTLADLVGFEDTASSSWYKFDSADIPVLLRPGDEDEELTVLSHLSSVVRGLKAVNQRRIYVPYDECQEARRKVLQLHKKKEAKL